MKYETALTFKDSETPAQIFKNCQRCKSDDLFEFDGDVFCNPCGWNSIEMHVESQLSALIAKHRRKPKAPKEPLPVMDIESVSIREDAAVAQARRLICGNPFLTEDDASVA